jgi:hypothetical protein
LRRKKYIGRQRNREERKIWETEKKEKRLRDNEIEKNRKERKKIEEQISRDEIEIKETKNREEREI